MAEVLCDVGINEVAHLLREKYIIITGGRSNEGNPIIFFPDNCNFSNLTDDDYKKLIIYISSVPSLQDTDLGFVLIVDRRDSKWSTVKTVLLKISGFFPALIQVVYVLRPSGFFQKTISEVSHKFFKEDFRFKVMICSSIEDLHQYVDTSQLTAELGGTMTYIHEEWIEQRMAVEKFAINLQSTAIDLHSMTQRLQETELPNDVAGTVSLLESHGLEYENLKEDLKNAARRGESLLSRIRRPSIEAVSLQLCPDKLDNVTTLERLLVQLEETEKGFNLFWCKHELRMNQCLQLRMFEQNYKEIQNNITSCMYTLCGMPTCGDSVVEIEHVQEELETFKLHVQEELGKAKELEKTGEDLINSNHYAVDSISPKCLELSKVVEDFKEQLDYRTDMLKKYHHLHAKIEQANAWCSKGFDLVAKQVDKYSLPHEAATEAFQEMEAFLQNAEELQLTDPNVFHDIFKETITPETRALVHQVLKRIEDVHSMCEKRSATLQKMMCKPVRPVQTVFPEPSVSLSDTENVKVILRDKKYINKIKHSKSVDYGDSSSHFRPIHQSSDPQSPFRSSTEEMQLMKWHVMRELIDTEVVYVSELNSIIQGYKRELEKTEAQEHIPSLLIGKVDILFGNMEDIYSFHCNAFVKHLKESSSIPESVGNCFLSEEETFHKLYSVYCLNKPKSELICRLCGEDPFFKECQKNLGQRLPLAAYLLLPVQRITKYQLLLKDLIKYCRADREQRQKLQGALETMLKVLKYVNDSMHQVAITGFQGCLTDYGQLLQQGLFYVWNERKKDRIPEIRFKAKQRYIFLYEKLVLFTKKYGKENSPSYAFKKALKTSEVGLTEKVRGDAKKFEIWLSGRSEIFTIQAPTEEVKNLWVKEIKKVLLQQFEHLKDENMKLYSEKLQSLASLYESNSQLSVMSLQDATESLDNYSMINNNSNSKKDPEDNQEDEWSLEELSQDEDEDMFCDAFESRGKYIALRDYDRVDVCEISLRESQVVEVEKVGCAGWWYVRILDTGYEGWVPASYLVPHPSTKRNSRSSPSVSSQDSGSLRHTASKSSVASSTSLEGASGQ